MTGAIVSGAGEEKDGWYPLVTFPLKRWHFFLKGEVTSLCGRKYKEYTLNGVPVPLNPTTVPFRDKCARCERILAVHVGVKLS